MAFSFDQVKDAATGRWKDLIFPALGIDVPAKPNKHSPCPACGGTDRFRCDDKHGNGTFICTNCGSGDGFRLVQLVRHWDNKQILKEIANILGISNASTITEQDRKKWREEQKNKQQLAEQEKQKGYQQAQKIAHEIWNSLQFNINSSPYLVKKMVQNFGCKIRDNGHLIIPMIDIQGQLCNLQEIHENGFKSFLKGGLVNGCFHVIGELTEYTEIICIVEGYATGASVHQATGHVTIITFNTANLPKVAVEIHKKYPKTLLVYCADDDRYSTPPNAGLKAAEKAVEQTGGIIVLPDFSIVGEYHE